MGSKFCVEIQFNKSSREGKSNLFKEETGFGTFSDTFKAAGTYTVAVGVMDVQDTFVDSGVLVDNFYLTDDEGNPVPGSHIFTIDLDDSLPRPLGGGES